MAQSSGKIIIIIKEDFMNGELFCFINLIYVKEVKSCSVLRTLNFKNNTFLAGVGAWGKGSTGSFESHHYQLKIQDNFKVGLEH